ncbi:MAG: sigma-70 family RNA polymerase sigma factor, partial [Muribaculaceae bacterium]|nr:sigma-70 family RNA polymerase sigma factor [Muribaculaceae bacterium]
TYWSIHKSDNNIITTMTIALHTSYTQRISLIELAASLFGDNTASSSSRELEKRFLALIRKEDSLISAICFSYSGSVAEYDDLRQDALINIWRGLPSFREDSTSRTWIYRVVLNSCVSTIRKQMRHSQASESLDGLYDILAEEPPEDRERIETLHRMISTLNPQDKAIILLWLDDASYDDIATVMGMPRNTVATRLHRIKEKLKTGGTATM